MAGEVTAWNELLGSNNWVGLVKPLDLGLRQLILRCGDLCESIYEAFNKADGGCGRSNKNSLLDILDNSRDYTVTNLVYATACVKPRALHRLSRNMRDRESNWIGYLAVTNDEVSRSLGRREVYIAFRGTMTCFEGINGLASRADPAERLLKSVRSPTDTPKVMNGWLKMYDSNDPESAHTLLSARGQIRTMIEDITKKYKDEKVSIIFTGHSLGACLSILAAVDILENGIVNGITTTVTAIVFASPRVGNKAFNEWLEEFPNLKILHVMNKNDPITHYPQSTLGYVNPLAKELLIDTTLCPAFKHTKTVIGWHSLQVLLYTVAGWNGEHEKFKLKVTRDLPILRKSKTAKLDKCIAEMWKYASKELNVGI